MAGSATTRRAVERDVPRRRGTTRMTVLAAMAGVMALVAFGGALGLLLGAIDFGEVVDQRLPLGSKPLAGVALAVVVGVPMVVAAVSVRRGSALSRLIAPAAALALYGWVVIEVAVTRDAQWRQLVCAVYAAVLLWLALRRDSDDGERRRGQR
ncbi:hypothetical protein [Actinokineospora globicatena]|uniref:hypothetical protein n=1 Tax=Actinokineospora globicatena TaxID=103729 RepID=UPI0020A3F389|nr:hypothetical protein [Actinokineospora globicatena]MCP2306135.1 hypothetical protein [Actinokineospora globicatena]GLW79990.1 hypothetical protein Aglo01_44710 [Actinokineospora globicatena]GLW86819.1 hypothetical protein Aglo02_44580 [Actinokineospora globicatena]